MVSWVPPGITSRFKRHFAFTESHLQMGANNACARLVDSSGNVFAKSLSGQYMYTSYPADGQTSNGGVKPASLYSECKTSTSWVTTATLSTTACAKKTTDACNQIASNISGLTEQ
jgi:hypothetical protein